jgi:uncharacterized protein with PQ loop repeat
MKITIDIVREFSGAIMSICCMFGALPQIYKVLKTKHASDLSPHSLSLGLIGGVSGLTYTLTGPYGVWLLINCISAITLQTVLLICWSRYK